MDDVRALQERLRGEGRHRDAQIIQHLIISANGSRSLNKVKSQDVERLREALTDIRNRVLCPVGPAPTIDQLGEIAGRALGDD